MFSFFKKKPAEPLAPPAQAAPSPASVPVSVAEEAPDAAAPAVAPRKTWIDKLKSGLRKTGSSIATVFTGTSLLTNRKKENRDTIETGVKSFSGSYGETLRSRSVSMTLRHYLS